MTSRPAAPPPPDFDLDSTAELPVLDPAGAGHADQLPGGTDILPRPPGLGAAPVSAYPGLEEHRQLQANLETATARLRETQELLTIKIERLEQLERARDEERSARAAAEERLAALDTELAASRATLARQAAQLAEAQRAHGDAEQQAAARSADLAQSQQQVSASRADSTRELVQLELREAQSRATGERMVADLDFERTRCLTYFDALQTAEAQRQMAVSLATEVQQELEQRVDELENLAREIARRDERVRGLETDLGEHSTREKRAEQQLNSFRARLEQRDTQLREARHEALGLQSSLTQLQQELQAAGERQRVLEAAAQGQQRSGVEQRGQLERLHSERADLDIALAAARTAAADTAAQVSAHESTLAGQGARIEELEAMLAAERARAAGLDEELNTVRGEMEQWSGALRTLQERNLQLADAGGGDARTRELEREVAEQRSAVAALKAESDAGAARIRELEADLQAAGDGVHVIESAAHIVGTHEDAEPSTFAGPPPPSEERESAAVPAAAPRAAGARRPTGPGADDGTARLLIRSDGRREIAHVLGRKTSIGRTPDNDLQIDAKYISRHHAVILAGNVQTIIEDLNSTNGVMVNGQRVARQVLNDGDQVMIGRALYRFTLRRGGAQH